MAEAVRNYASYLTGPHAWALGRFVVPAARLNELAEAACNLWRPDHPWRISALVNTPQEFSICATFSARHIAVARIDTVEVKAASADEIRSLIAATPTGITTYVELTIASAPQLIPVLAATMIRAKVRTGSMNALGFPTCAELADFIALCAQAQVPFKATAGLHHPLRRVAPLTYESNSATATMHGFLNLFVAAGFLTAGWDRTRVMPILEDTDPASFRNTADGLSWHNHCLDHLAITHSRTSGLQSFGSCSFSEPITELISLGLLPATESIS